MLHWIVYHCMDSLYMVLRTSVSYIFVIVFSMSFCNIILVVIVVFQLTSCKISEEICNQMLNVSDISHNSFLLQYKFPTLLTSL